MDWSGLSIVYMEIDDYCEIEAGYDFGKHRLSIMLDHISNADLGESNIGLDIIGIRYGYKFN